MKLKRITIRNFMPYKGEHIIQFPTDDDRNILIVFGDNMRGKTSLLNSIRWGLYGRAIKNLTSDIPIIDIVNKEATAVDDWRVESHLEFEANGHSYDLRRVADRKNSDRTPSSSNDFSTNVFLRKDGDVIQGDMIDIEINNIAPEAVSRFFLFDGELLQEYETLLVDDSSQGRRIKESIEQVLGVPTLVNGRVDVKTISTKAKKQQSIDLKRVAGLEKQAEHSQSLIADIESIEEDISVLNKRIAETNLERQNLEKEIEASRSVLESQANLSAKKERKQEVMAENELKYESKLELITDAWRDLLFVKIDAHRINLVKDQVDVTAEIKKNSRQEISIENLRILLDESLCPTCGMELSDKRRNEIEKQIVAAEERLGSLEKLSDHQASLSSQISRLSIFKNQGILGQMRAISKDIAKNEILLTSLENEIELLREEIEGHDTTELRRKRNKMLDLGREEARLKVDLESQRDKLKSKTDEQAVAQKAIEGLTKNRTQRSTRKVNLCADLEQLFNQSVEKLRDRLRLEVERVANEAFAKMTTQQAYKGLEINENYGLSIIDSSDRKVAVRSAGAEQVIALSLIDGLNRTGRQAGPLIMDTPFGRLDLKHRENILTYLPSVTSQFMLFVHPGEIRKETDLGPITHKIGAAYEINEISETESKLTRVDL